MYRLGSRVKRSLPSQAEPDCTRLIPAHIGEMPPHLSNLGATDSLILSAVWSMLMGAVQMAEQPTEPVASPRHCGSSTKHIEPIAWRRSLCVWGARCGCAAQCKMPPAAYTKHGSLSTTDAGCRLVQYEGFPESRCMWTLVCTQVRRCFHIGSITWESSEPHPEESRQRSVRTIDEILPCEAANIP